MPEADFEHLQDVVRHRYDVEALVGRGGMGAVYRARHVSLDAPVAIKVLPVPASIGEDELARFRREAMLAARLPNPHIVPVYEFEIRGDLAYLVMPLIEGVSLAQRLSAEGPLPLAEVRRLVEQIGGALAFAHARGIIHRDVKPANILWEPANSRWLITDFGIARYVRAEDDAITSVGAVLGTPAYMAPEQAAGLELDGRTDMYALAATACEALTGRRLKPLAGRDTAVQAMLAAPMPVPPKVAALLALPLVASPDERPPTMDAWLAQVTGPRDRPWWRRTAVMLVAAAATIVAGITWLVSSTATPPADAGTVIAVVPFTDGTALGLSHSLAQAFEDELRWVPDVQIVPAATVEEVVGTLDLSSPTGLDSATMLVLARFGAGARVLSGAIVAEAAGSLRLSVQLRQAGGRTTTVPDQRGVPDSLASSVARAVLRLFGPAAGEASYRPSLPGGGLEAMGALRAGDSLFRAAAY
ncbi:MAG: serine/threonine protein kinase, partial [Gemmatimonadota bacterium]|nr:serine/threonine protein kinase [Gemmatimonadota bacterium]